MVNWTKMRIFIAVMAVTLTFPLAVHATPIAPPVVDGGWAYDQIGAASTDSDFSPYVYALSAPALFSITDAYIVGDQYFVYDFGSPILTTALFSGTAFGDDAFVDAAWTSGLYQGGQVILAAGPHSLTVQGDGVGGLPAGFYDRLDSVPEPSTLLLLGSGLAGLGLWGRKKFKANS